MIHIFTICTLLCAAFASAYAQQNNTLIGAITGTVRGEDGTAIGGATILLHRAVQTHFRSSRQATDWSTLTTAGGTYNFTGLPSGYYSVCAGLKGSTWLNPCEWGYATPTATISLSNPYSSVAIILNRGSAIPIRVDDGGQLLEQHEGKTRGAGMFMSVSSGGLFSRLVPIVSKNGSGRDYQIVVPYNTLLMLVVHPSYFIVHDSAETELSQANSTNIPLLVGSGQQVKPINFKIVGVGQARGGK